MIYATMPLFATTGDTSLDYLTDYWREANKRWFRGKLKPIPIGINPAMRPMGQFVYNLGTKQTYIQVHADLLRHGLDNPRRYWNATGTLLHEMIHQYLHERVDWRISGHGVEFTEQCNRIGPDLGLGPVVARKPRNRTAPLARHWPRHIYPAKAVAS